MRQRLDLERRYALYRLGRLSEAANGLDGASSEDAKLLLAQAQYKRGEFAAAGALFAELLAGCDADERPALAADLVACRVSEAAVAQAEGRAADWGAVDEALREAGAEAGGTGDVSFNLACGFFHQGRLESASAALDAARTLGEEALFEEGVEGAEADRDLAHVASLRAAVDAARGEPAAALAALDAVWALRPTDPATRAAVAVNRGLLGLAAGAAKPRDALAAVDKVAALPGPTSVEVGGELAPRLGAAQRAPLHCARACFLAAGGRAEEARQIVARCSELFPGSGALAAARAALLAHEGQAEAALSALDGADLGPSGGAELRAALALSLRGRAGRDRAIAVLSATAADGAPRDVRAMARVRDLYMRQGNAAGCAEFLEAGAVEWRSAPPGPARDRALAWLGLALGEARAAAGDGAGAAEAARAALGPGGAAGERYRAAALVAAAASLRPELRSWALPEAEGVVGGPAAGAGAGDAGAGLAELRARGLRGGAGKRGRAADGADGADAPERKRKRRKPRYPRGFDPARPGPAPDPERWLPKYQRKGFKHKFKKVAKREALKGAQGGSRANEALDLYNQPQAKDKEEQKGPSLPRLPAKGRRGRK